MVFGSMGWTRVRSRPTRRDDAGSNNCCAFKWSSQRYKRKGKFATHSVRQAEPKDDEETVFIDMRLNEVSGEKETTTNAIVFTENSNFSSRYSLKLKIHGTYTIVLAIDPSLELKYFKLKDHRFKLSENGSEMSDAGKKLYKYTWSVGDVPKTKNSKRFILSGMLKIEGHKKLKFDMLVKFYREEERRVYDGDQLSSIALEFIVPKDPGAHPDGGEDSDAEEEPESKFHIVNDMTFNTVEDED